MLRPPAVAGQFYPSSPESLRKQVEAFILPHQPKQSAMALVCPHAGLIYSGPVAGAVYSRILIPETIVLVGPNHTGLGAHVSVYNRGAWRMPQGTIEINGALADAVLDQSRFADADMEAHRLEHCIEVQLPFLQHFHQDLTIVPIVMMSIDLAACQDLGEALASAIRSHAKPGGVLMIASTDMTHYEPDSVARDKDRWAVDQILALNPPGLHQIVKDKQISMCGFAPTVAVLYSALRLGAKHAQLIRYMTSGETSGDYEQVVGYAGLIIT
ncbi:MAG TPA: AmmeMemoRadiSam system protein B [Nitrospiria bacterium]|nr:AmmeMemoRadiSam system protein B [Nitrospiria bacterium]